MCILDIRVVDPPKVATREFICVNTSSGLFKECQHSGCVSQLPAQRKTGLPVDCECYPGVGTDYRHHSIISYIEFSFDDKRVSIYVYRPQLGHSQQLNIFPTTFLNSSTGLLLGERSESKVWLDNVHLGEELLCLVALDARVDNDIVTCMIVSMLSMRA